MRHEARESDEDLLLRLATYWKQKKSYQIPTVGSLLESYMRTSVKPAKKGVSVVEAWKTVVPPVMDEFCRIESFKGGVLRMKVSDAAYRFQMEMLKKELIESIEAELGGKSKLKDIKFI